MNSLWIPQLGGQEYTMPGMVDYLWLEADHPGTFQGLSANYSGKYFAHMTFKVNAMKPTDFAAWAAGVKKSAPAQTAQDWTNLVKPGLVGTLTYSAYPSNAQPELSPSNTHMKMSGDSMNMGSSSSSSMSGMNMSGK